jgi:glycosyltransferase involved in cell wall biosynthesis
VTSVGVTLDAFFPEIIRALEVDGIDVYPAAGTAANMRSDVIKGVTRQPSLSNVGSVTRHAQEWVESRDLDVVLTNTATASAIMRLANLPCPTVYFCHGLHWTSDNAGATDRLWQVAESALLRKTDAAIVINSDDEAWFAARRRHVPVHRLRYGVGVNTEHFARSLPPQGVGHLTILWAGEFSDRKRPMDALKVARHLRQRGVNFTLIMAGNGPLWQSVRASAQRWGLAGEVVFPGQIDIAACLRTSNVLLHTAAWEGLPRIMLETLSVGRPIVSYDIKGARDLPGVQLAPFGDIERLSQLLVRAETSTTEFPDQDAYQRAAEGIKDVMESVVA